MMRMSAWEVHAVIGKIVPIPEKDLEYMEAVKPFNLQNKHAYMVKYSNVTVIGDQSFEGQKFDFTMALMFSDVATEELYGEGISHEILYRNFPAPVRCAFLTVDMLRLHKVPRVKGVTDEDWIPVFFVRHAPYYSEAQRKFKELPAANIQLMATTELARKLVLIQIDGKIMDREQEARKKGIDIGRREGEATIRDFEAGLDRGIQVPRFKAHPKLTVFIVGIVATAILAYWIGWLRV